MKEIRHLLLPNNLFNLNVLELCSTNEEFKELTNKRKHNYFYLNSEQIDNYKNIIKPNYFDVIFMDSELTNEILVQLFDLIQYSIKKSGRCLINLNKDVTTIPTDFEIYDVNDEFFIYKNIDVLGYKRQEELWRQEKLRKEKELEEKLRKEEELRKEKELEEKLRKEEELKKEKELKEKELKEKELKNNNDYKKGLKNLFDKLEKIDSTPSPKSKKNVVIKNKPKNYSVGPLSLNEKKPTKKINSKKIKVQKEKPTKKTKKVNIVKQTLNKVKNKLTIRPRRGSRPKL